MSENKRRTSKTVLAMYLGWDMGDLKDCIYQHGFYTKPVYTIGNNYMCIVKSGQKPAKHTRYNTESTQFKWEEKIVL